MPQDGQPRRVSLVLPIILITVGALFLLHNWRPAFDPGPILWTYWPLILIFVGVGKIWDSSYRSRNPNAAPTVSMGASVGAGRFRRRAGPAFLARTQFFPSPQLRYGIASRCTNRRSARSEVGTRQARDWRWTTHYQRRRHSHAGRGLQV